MSVLVLPREHRQSPNDLLFRVVSDSIHPQSQHSTPTAPVHLQHISAGTIQAISIHLTREHSFVDCLINFQLIDQTLFHSKSEGPRVRLNIHEDQELLINLPVETVNSLQPRLTTRPVLDTIPQPVTAATGLVKKIRPGAAINFNAASATFSLRVLCKLHFDKAN